jgi:hypothetical protein
MAKNPFANQAKNKAPLDYAKGKVPKAMDRPMDKKKGKKKARG